MTYVIAEPCIDIKDQSCIDVCPVDCIHVAARILVIDAEECIDCGACEPECPVEAIFPEDALPEKWEPFVKINAAFNESMAVVDKLVDDYATEHNVQNWPLPAAATCRRRDVAAEEVTAPGRLKEASPLLAASVFPCLYFPIE